MPEEKKKEVPLVRVYNRHERKYIERHEGADVIVTGGTFSEIPKPCADRLMAMFPKDIVEASVAVREVNGANAQIAEANARIAELEAQLKKSSNSRIAELTADLAAAEKLADELQAQNTKLKAASSV